MVFASVGSLTVQMTALPRNRSCSPDEIAARTQIPFFATHQHLADIATQMAGAELYSGARRKEMKASLGEDAIEISFSHNTIYSRSEAGQTKQSDPR